MGSEMCIRDRSLGSMYGLLRKEALMVAELNEESIELSMFRRMTLYCPEETFVTRIAFPSLCADTVLGWP